MDEDNWKYLINPDPAVQPQDSPIRRQEPDGT